VQGRSSLSAHGCSPTRPRRGESSRSSICGQRIGSLGRASDWNRVIPAVGLHLELIRSFESEAAAPLSTECTRIAPRLPRSSMSSGWAGQRSVCHSRPRRTRDWPRRKRSLTVATLDGKQFGVRDPLSAEAYVTRSFDEAPWVIGPIVNFFGDLNPCAAETIVGIDRILNRPAIRIHCSKFEIYDTWVDQQSGLLLRQVIQAPSDREPGWSGFIELRSIPLWTHVCSTRTRSESAWLVGSGNLLRIACLNDPRRQVAFA
jgi:hypothetical protein